MLRILAYVRRWLVVRSPEYQSFLTNVATRERNYEARIGLLLQRIERLEEGRSAE